MVLDGTGSDLHWIGLALGIRMDGDRGCGWGDGCLVLYEERGGDLQARVCFPGLLLPLCLVLCLYSFTSDFEIYLFQASTTRFISLVDPSIN